MINFLGALGKIVGFGAKAAPAAMEVGFETTGAGMMTAGAEAASVATQGAFNIGASIVSEASNAAIGGVEKTAQATVGLVKEGSSAVQASHFATNIEQVLSTSGPDAALSQLAGEQAIPVSKVAAMTEVVTPNLANQELLAKLNLVMADQKRLLEIVEQTGLDLAQTQKALAKLTESIRGNKLTKEEMAMILAVYTLNEMKEGIEEKDVVK